MDYGYFDYDDGCSQWFKTDDIYRCGHCGHVGPAEAKAEEETQGDGVMTGTVMLATGELRCAECESNDLSSSEPEGSP